MLGWMGCCLITTKWPHQELISTAQSVQQTVTRWMIHGSNPGGGRELPHLSRPALEEFYNQESTHLKATTTHHTTAQTGPSVGTTHTDLPKKFLGLWVLKTFVLMSQKNFGTHPVTTEKPQNNLITLQSKCSQYSAKLHTFSCPPVFDFSTLYSEASNNYQFYLHPHFPKTIFLCTHTKQISLQYNISLDSWSHTSHHTSTFPPTLCQYTVLHL